MGKLRRTGVGGIKLTLRKEIVVIIDSGRTLDANRKMESLDESTNEKQKHSKIKLQPASS